MAYNDPAAVALGYFAYNFTKNYPGPPHDPRHGSGCHESLWEVADLVATLGS